MKFPTIALSAIGASIAMLSSAPAFAAAHSGKPMDSATAASAAMNDKARATSDKTRAEVKQARDAATPIPAGENVSNVPGQEQTKGRMSDTTRAEVKQETKAAKRAGETLPAGENVTRIPGEQQTKGKNSATTRAEVKQKAAKAKKEGTAIQPGEALTKAQEMGQKQ